MNYMWSDAGAECKINTDFSCSDFLQENNRTKTY